MSFIIGSTVGLKVLGLNEIIKALGNIKGTMPQTKKRIHQKLGQEFVKISKRDAHRITGRTASSIRLTRADERGAEVTAQFGMPWEERRGGDHATFSNTGERISPIFGLIIKTEVDDLFRRNRTTAA